MLSNIVVKTYYLHTFNNSKVLLQSSGFFAKPFCYKTFRGICSFA